MDSKQKNKMIICESLSLSIQAVFIAIPISLVLFITMLTNEIGTAGISEVKVISIAIIYIFIVLIVTTLVGLIPVRSMKNQSISNLLRD